MSNGVILLLLAGLCSVSVQTIPDPRCLAKACPSETTCRVVKVCDSPQTPCTMKAHCLAVPPQNSHTGVCDLGDPILVDQGNKFEDLTCGPDFPCPDGAYCNTRLMDTYSTCCMSNPDAPVKPWACPANTYTDDDFCVDTCNNDGDCFEEEKCCVFGCNKACVPRLEPCDTKQCPRMTYCQREGMPNCTSPGQCHAVGDCVQCPPVCAIYCIHGNVMDPNGCPTCRCKGPRPPMPVEGNKGNRLGPPFVPPWLWAFLLFNLVSTIMCVRDDLIRGVLGYRWILSFYSIVDVKARRDDTPDDDDVILQRWPSPYT